MPAKGHDKSKGAAGSTKKPMKERKLSDAKRADGKLTHETESPDMSPSPGGWPEGQPMEQKY